MITSDEIFGISSEADFEAAALEIFHRQARDCAPYRDYLALAGFGESDISGIKNVKEIPFLPAELFKTHKVYCGGGGTEPDIVFTSSSTTGMTPARHYVADISIYERSFTTSFEAFYGPLENISIYALLPGYLEREGSSLVYMADRLIKLSRGGGFYLDRYDRLLEDMKREQGPKLLLGVSYALWDMAEKHPGKLQNTIIMETGGMKGNRPELPREEFHKILSKAFGVECIHSEYGMAELLSQGYSCGGGIFRSPPWMKVLCRDIYDPFLLLAEGIRGGINVIDLANIHSCSFIQTQDIGVNLGGGRFRIDGRISGSDIRGCNLLVQN